MKSSTVPVLFARHSEHRFVSSKNNGHIYVNSEESGQILDWMGKVTTDDVNAGLYGYDTPSFASLRYWLNETADFRTIKMASIDPSYAVGLFCWYRGGSQTTLMSFLTSVASRKFEKPTKDQKGSLISGKIALPQQAWWTKVLTIIIEGGCFGRQDRRRFMGITAPKEQVEALGERGVDVTAGMAIFGIDAILYKLAQFDTALENGPRGTPNGVSIIEGAKLVFKPTVLTTFSLAITTDAVVVSPIAVLPNLSLAVIISVVYNNMLDPRNAAYNDLGSGSGLYQRHTPVTLWLVQVLSHVYHLNLRITELANGTGYSLYTIVNPVHKGAYPALWSVPDLIYAVYGPLALEACRVDFRKNLDTFFVSLNSRNDISLCVKILEFLRAISSNSS